MQAYNNEGELYGVIKRQDINLIDKELDASITYYRGRFYKILVKAATIDELNRSARFFNKLKGSKKAKIYKDPRRKTGFEIEKIIK